MFGAGGDLSKFGFRTLLPVASRPGSLGFAGIDGVLVDRDLGIFDGGAYLGWRNSVGGGWITGAWAGVDVQRTRHDKIFGRFIGGVEAVSSDWILRASVAAPFDDEKFVSSATTQSSQTTTSTLDTSEFIVRTDVTTTNISTTLVSEQAPTVWDGEVGARLYFDRNRNEELRLSAGAYLLDGYGNAGTVAGFKTRAELDLYILEAYGSDTRLTLEGEYAWDHVRDDQFRASVRVAVPLRLAGLRERVTGLTMASHNVTREPDLFHPVRRNTDVVTALVVNTTSQNSTTTTTTSTAKSFDASKLCSVVKYIDLFENEAEIAIEDTGINLAASIPNAASLPMTFALEPFLLLETSSDGRALSLISVTVTANGCSGRTQEDGS